MKAAAVAIVVASVVMLPPVAALGLSIEIRPDDRASHSSATPVAAPSLDAGDSNHGLVLAFGPRSTTQTLSAPGDPLAVDFVCPDLRNNTNRVLGCPLYILDPEDVMGQPRLLVDGREDGWYAFHALHGGRGVHTGLGADAPPSNRSRMDQLHQPHTVFTTIDHWLQPNDYRYHSPWWGEDGGQYYRLYGEDNAGALDGEGRIFVASLYAYRDEADTSFRYVVVTWKHGRVNYEPDWNSHYRIVQPAAPTNTIDSLHAAYVPEADRDVVLWREQSLDLPARDSWIRVAVAEPGPSTTWELMDRANSVGPCKSISNPVALAGVVYIACLPDEGYSVPGIDPAFWQVHAIDPLTLEGRHVALVPLSGGRAILAPRFGDEMVLVASDAPADGPGQAPSVRFAFGSPSRPRWERSFLDAGPQLTNRTLDAPDLHVVDASIQAVAIAPQTRNIHLIYRERYEHEEAALGRFGLPQVYKSFAALDPNANRVLLARDLQIGSVSSRIHFDPQYQGQGEGVFDDEHDDLFVVDTPRGPREFVAFGDYGYVRFAEVVERNGILVPFAPLNAPPPLPAANPGLDPATMGAVAGLLAGAMALRLLSARRKHKVEAPSL